MAKVAAVILAAGESARFGKPKQFLRFRGKTLLRRIVDAASEADCAPVIKQLISLREKTAKQIVASSYAETLGVPALFDRSCFKELLALNDSAGAKSIVLSNPERLAKLYFPGAKIDIDTVADFEKLP